MSTSALDPLDPSARAPLPADDPAIFEFGLDRLAARWADAADRLPVNAEQMSGADLRAQRLGVPGRVLMAGDGRRVCVINMERFEFRCCVPDG